MVSVYELFIIWDNVVQLSNIACAFLVYGIIVSTREAFLTVACVNGTFDSCICQWKQQHCCLILTPPQTVITEETPQKSHILHHSLNLVGRIFPHKCKIASVDQLMALCPSPHS